MAEKLDPKEIAMCIEHIEKLGEVERNVTVLTTTMNRVVNEMVGSAVYNKDELRGVFQGLEEMRFDLKNYVNVAKVRIEG